MKRAWFLSFLLASCTPEPTTVVWVTPKENEKVAGVVRLQVEALADPAPTNVTFFVDGSAVGKAYGDNGRFEVTWNSTSVPSGDVVLAAKPYAAPPIRTTVEVTGGEIID